jgi:aerobic-type carbon monoxide dehydrogenase small subunit (CoxS/CutS family)
VQQGVVDEQGFQCAFCMPGFVMAATGYLKTNPNPTRQELAHGVSGQSVPLPGLRQDSHRADAWR